MESVKKAPAENAGQLKYRNRLAEKAGYASFYDYQKNLRKKRRLRQENKMMGLTIKRGLEKLGESYIWLAEKVGVSKTSIGYYARGESLPDDEIRRRILEILGGPERIKSEQPAKKNIAENIITLENFASAIRKTLYADEKNNSEADRRAAEDAERVMDFFGYSGRIIDNVLENAERDLFYSLEDAGLLSIEKEETTVPFSGKEWRINCWVLNREKILSCSAETPRQEIDVPGSEDVYAGLPQDVWLNHARKPEVLA